MKVVRIRSSIPNIALKWNASQGFLELIKALSHIIQGCVYTKLDTQISGLEKTYKRNA